MERSEQIDQLATALAKFQGELEQPKMNSTVKVRTRSGSEYSFKYADLAECKQAAKKPLSENGLAVTQLIEEDYSILTMLVHSSGQWISSRVKMPVTEQGAQAIGSALTYAKRYAFCAILGIVADDDEDGNLSQGNTPSKMPEPPKQGKRMFDLKLADDENFMRKIFDNEQAARAKGERFSLKNFIEYYYRIDDHAFQTLSDGYMNFKINNSLP